VLGVPSNLGYFVKIDSSGFLIKRVWSMSLLGKSTRKLMALLDHMACVLLALITGFGFINVLLRYVFAKPISYNEEMSVLGLAWMVYLSQGLLEADNDQLRMTALYRAVGWKIRPIINGLRSALTIGVSGYLLYAGVKLTYRNYSMQTVTQSLGIPLWIAFLSVPVAFACIILVRSIDPFVRSGQDKG
jgi:TRAP-type C4-dicarboxylate transport system permease small subunit